MSKKNEQFVPDEMVTSKIYFIRKHKVMQDEDLADFGSRRTGEKGEYH